MVKNISLLGSTGSIGMQTLDVVRAHPEEFRVTAVTGNSKLSELTSIVNEFHPEFVAVRDEKQASEIIANADYPVQVGIGMDGLISAATWSSTSLLVNAVVGAAGIQPTLAALQSGRDVALANKETLVAAGDLVHNAAKAGGSKILPIDSEHSAIMQCLIGNSMSAVEKIILTASGGPFRGYSSEELKSVTVKDALAHPTWKMGAKITVDSATLMNKGLEVIEAHYLYHVPYEQIEVLVHPQSIVHSMVAFSDGAVMAQMGTADMRIPIQFALFGGTVRESAPWKRLDFKSFSSLTFENPDRATFRALDLAYSCGKSGGTYPAVLNAANEVAALAFLENEIRFSDIVHIVEETVEKHDKFMVTNLQDVLEWDGWARAEALHLIRKRRTQL